MCVEMKLIHIAEAHARDWLASARIGWESSKDLQAIYAQWALVAQRMQAVHAANCAECQKEEVRGEFIPGTGIDAAFVAGRHRAGDSIAELADEYDLPESAIIDAVHNQNVA